MKKYITPQTEAIQLISENSIMAGSLPPFNPGWSDDSGEAI